MLKFATHAWLRGLAWGAISLSLMVAVAYGYLYAQLPTAPDHKLPPTKVWSEEPAAEALTSFEAALFKRRAAEPAASLGPLAKRFRLAGTFFAIGSHQQARKAIIDDLQRQEQQLVAEGDMLAQTVLVLSIFPERILVREGGHEEELRLAFSGAVPLPGLTDQIAQSTAGGIRFGQRVGERRWVLQREALLEYYQDLLNNTERLAKVFDSLKPVYKADRIAGYVLIVEGEDAMFKDFGLKEHDIIRQVNSMPMISQGRAEYFIREFVNNRLNAFVLDIEREGQAQKLIYLIR